MPATSMEVDKENLESADVGSVESKAPMRSKGVSADDNREAFSPDLLRIYYARLFPYEQVMPLVRMGWVLAAMSARCNLCGICGFSWHSFCWCCCSDRGISRFLVRLLCYLDLSNLSQIQISEQRFLKSRAFWCHAPPTLDRSINSHLPHYWWPAYQRMVSVYERFLVVCSFTCSIVYEFSPSCLLSRCCSLPFLINRLDCVMRW